MKPIDRELALRQLAAMLGSGLPLVTALESCAEQAARRRDAAVWRRVAESIGAGGTFSAALAASSAFDAYEVALAEVGEATGELARTMRSAADYLAKRREHRAMVVNALFYPVIVVVATLAVVWFMLAKVVPALKEFLEGQQQRLPAITLLLVDVSDWVVAHGPAIAVWTAFAAIAFALARRNAAFREASDAAFFRAPAAGGILRLSATAEFARSLGLLLGSGVTLLAALETVEGIFANRRVRSIVAAARRNVIRGGTLSEVLRGRREFEPLLGRMAATGESTGTLDAALGEVAKFHEERLQAAIKRLGMVMEPVLIVVVGSIVGFVYIAFFLAIFALAGAR